MRPACGFHFGQPNNFGAERDGATFRYGIASIQDEANDGIFLHTCVTQREWQIAGKRLLENDGSASQPTQKGLVLMEHSVQVEWLDRGGLGTPRGQQLAA